jgi:predicted AAA+ superfamily ATPase
LYGLSKNEMYGDSSTPFLPTFERIKKMESRKNPGVDELYKIIHRGQYPALIKDPDISAQEYYASYVQTYLDRDIRDLITIKDSARFMKFLSSAAVRTGQELVYEDIARDAEVDVKTAQSWLSLLTATGIVHLLVPYSNNAIKRIIKRPKLYFMDTGLACYLAKYVDSRTLEVSAYSGHIFETYVMSEIIKTYGNYGLFPELYLYYFRDGNKTEIDLLIIQNGVVHPVEIKKSASPGRGSIKSFRVLEPLGNAGLAIGEGGVLCMVDKVVPIDEKNSFIPLQCI